MLAGLVGIKGKYWRYNYRFNKKHKILALGVYPDVSLKDARIAHEDARDLLNRGIDPSEYKKIQKATKAHIENTSFEGVAREWFLMWKDEHTESHTSRIIARLENDVFPWLGDRPIAENWRPFNSVGQGVREIRVQVGTQYRIMYVVKFEESIHVLHAFQKKTQKTRKSDIDYAKTAYKELIKRYQ